MSKSTTKQTQKGDGIYREQYKTTISKGGTFGKKATGVGKTAEESQKNAKKSKDKQGW